MGKNLVVVDFDSEKVKNKDEWNKFINGLNESTGDKWELYGTPIKDESFHSKERYIHYFQLGWSLFINRRNIDNIIANQQFYGIVFAFFCSQFHVKKCTNNIVVSFIYNKKHGFAGKIYEKFIRKSVNSKYVDKLIVHSESEIQYYSELLEIATSKIQFCPLGITDDSREYDIREANAPEDTYVLGVGNSNRDFAFLKNALIGEKYDVRIFSDSLEPYTAENVFIKKGIPVPEYYSQLANCFCSVVPIDNPNFSTGQLIMLQSYAFGKPVIITKSNVNNEYIGDGNAIVINKDAGELKKAIESLKNKEFYASQAQKAHAFFIEKFSMFAMGKRLGQTIIRLKQV